MAFLRSLKTFPNDATSLVQAAVAVDFSERKKAMSSTLPGKELASKVFDSVRDHFKKDGFFKLAGRFTEAEWRKTVADTLPFARVLLELVDAFGERYQEDKSKLQALDFSD